MKTWHSVGIMKHHHEIKQRIWEGANIRYPRNWMDIHFGNLSKEKLSNNHHGCNNKKPNGWNLAQAKPWNWCPDTPTTYDPNHLLAWPTRNLRFRGEERGGQIVLPILHRNSGHVCAICPLWSFSESNCVTMVSAPFNMTYLPKENHLLDRKVLGPAY